MYFMCILLHFYPRIRAFKARLPPPVTPVPPPQSNNARLLCHLCAHVGSVSHGIMRERAPGGNVVVSGWFSVEDSLD